MLRRVHMLGAAILAAAACAPGQARLEAPVSGGMGSAIACLRDHANAMDYDVLRADPEEGVFRAERQSKHSVLFGFDNYLVIRGSIFRNTRSEKIALTAWREQDQGKGRKRTTSPGDAPKEARALLDACSSAAPADST